MKTATKILVILILVLTVFGSAMPASAGGGGGTGKFRGESASAFFSSVDSSGCIFTDVSVFASEGVFQSSPGPGNFSSGASLFISQYDVCLGVQLIAADGGVSLAGPDFQVVSKLQSASLHATIDVFDYVSGTPFQVAVNLGWTASAPLSRQNSNSHFQSPGCIFNSHFSGSFRPAIAWGSVSDGVTEFVPTASFDASISSVKSGTVAIGCGL
jgi:hypothetical protein